MRGARGSHRRPGERIEVGRLAEVLKGSMGNRDSGPGRGGRLLVGLRISVVDMSRRNRRATSETEDPGATRPATISRFTLSATSDSAADRPFVSIVDSWTQPILTTPPSVSLSKSTRATGRRPPDGYSSRTTRSLRPALAGTELVQSLTCCGLKLLVARAVRPVELQSADSRNGDPLAAPSAQAARY